jgi:hypothetical protein
VATQLQKMMMMMMMTITKMIIINVILSGTCVYGSFRMVSPSLMELNWVKNIIFQVNVKLSTVSVGRCLLCVHLVT